MIVSINYPNALVLLNILRPIAETFFYAVPECRSALQVAVWILEFYNLLRFVFEILFHAEL